jgi:hypothetical protein
MLTNCQHCMPNFYFGTVYAFIVIERDTLSIAAKQ